MQGEPSLSPFDVRELLDEVVQIVPGLIDDKPIVFECDYDRDFPLVVTNREKLKQVLGYLLNNAVKFTEQGKIVPGASRWPEAVEFWVEDTGVGIEAINLGVYFRRLSPGG